MKNKFHYDSQEQALEAFIGSFKNDFENIIYEVDYWLRELIRDSPDDENWVNGFLTYVGKHFENDFQPTLAWFNIEVKHPQLWTSKSYSLIKQNAKENS